MTFTITRLGLRAPAGDALDALAARFADSQFLVLPSFLDPQLLEIIRSKMAQDTFYERTHDGIGVEMCLVPGPTSGLLELMLNDEGLYTAVQRVTGCEAIGCFEGRVYRMVPGSVHYDSWHGDVGEGRQVALSLNLGGVYAGGALQLARTDSEELLADVANTGPGDALLFRIAPNLRHRVTAVGGQEPKTAYAGWFRSYPHYHDLWRAAFGGSTSAQG